MLVKEENFRNLYKSFVIIKDEEFARQIAQTLELNTIAEDGLSGENLNEKLESVDVNDEINAIFAIPYIDHTMGMSILILSTAHLEGSDVTIFKRKDFTGLVNARKGSINDSEFEYLENLNVNDEFDLDYYTDFAKVVDAYHVNDNVEALRFAEELDSSRQEDFPDDVEVLFIKDGCKIERMWARLEDIDEENFIVAELLNTPYQDLGVDAGDMVKIFPYKPEDGDEWVLVCDLNE